MILFQAMELAESSPEGRLLDERNRSQEREGFWHRLESLFGAYAELLVKGLD